MKSNVRDVKSIEYKDANVLNDTCIAVGYSFIYRKGIRKIA
jgi:hypothetical protein